MLIQHGLPLEEVILPGCLQEVLARLRKPEAMSDWTLRVLRPLSRPPSFPGYRALGSCRQGMAMRFLLFNQVCPMSLSRHWERDLGFVFGVSHYVPWLSTSPLPVVFCL